jgi:S-adenosylmethionine decarboxylase
MTASVRRAPAPRFLGWLSSGDDELKQTALLRSGKALASPGTLRKKDISPATPAPIQAQESADHFIVKNGVRCAGAHLIIDLYKASRLDDLDHIEATLRRCVEAARATLLHIHLHHFQPNGVSGVAVLAESHISIHTWPDAGYAALDVFMCGKASPDACIPVLREAFKAERVEVNEILRGQRA